MQSAHLTDPTVLAQGAFNAARLDPYTGNLASVGTPAIVADIDPSTGSAVAISATGTLAGTWTLSSGSEVTSTVASTWTYVTSAYALDLQYLTPTIGAIAHVTVDGQARKGFDSSNSATNFWRLYLDGQQHTVVVTYSGDAVIGTPLIGAVADTAGTAGLAAALRLARTGGAVLGATWGFQATSTTAITVLKGGVSQGSLNSGQTSTTLIPGVSLSLVAGTWDATSQAQGATTAPTLGLTQVTPYTGLAAAASYGTPVMDSGDPQAQWPLVELREGPLGPTAPAIMLGVGQSSTPDATWTWVALGVTVVADPDGNPWSRLVGAGNGARGRFAQAILTFQTAQRAWLGDLRLFWWVPETDSFLRLFPAQTYRGPVVTRPLLAAVAALFAYVDEQADNLLAGAALPTAYDGYLSGYGQQFAMPRLAGEGDSAYRARLTTLFSGRQQGGSRPFLQTTLSGALGCPVQVTKAPRGTSAFILGSTALGTQGLGQTAIGFWQWSVTIPFAGLQVAPETAQQIVTQLRPVGSIVSILYS